MTTSEPAAADERPWLPVLVFTVFGSVLLAGAFRHFDWLGAKDWNSAFGQAQAEITSLRDHAQFPLWNPWRRGGQVSFAQPESMLLTPVTPLALAVGVVAAFKLLLLPLFVFGCFGGWRLAGRLGLKGAARLVPSLMFYGSAIFPYYLAGGLPNWLFGLALLPWLIAWTLDAERDVRFVLAAGGAYALLLWCGSIYQFVFYPLLIGLIALTRAAASRSLRPLVTAFVCLTVGVALALVRVLPIFDVYQVFPRELPATERYLTPALIAKSFFDPSQPDLLELGGTVFRDAGNWVSWVTVGAYFGPVFGALVALGFLFRPRQALAYLVIAVFFAWMSLGSSVHPSLWEMLHHLPILKSMQAPERLLKPTVFVLSLAAGFGADAVIAFLRRRLAPRTAAFAVVALLAAAVLPPLVANRTIASAAFIVPPTDPLPAAGPFVQARHAKQPYEWGGELYESVLTNRGNPTGHSDVPSHGAVAFAGEPGYRGEVYLARGHGAVSSAITPNEIHVTADVTADDDLVVNQNYFPGWEATGTVARAAQPKGYLISLPVPKGRHDFTLKFHEPSVARGALLSLLALLLGAIGVVLRTYRRVSLTQVTPIDLVLLGGIAATIASIPLAPRLTAANDVSVEREAIFGGALEVDAAPGARAKFSAIQPAIDAALPGETIFVHPGRYAGFHVASGVQVIATEAGAARLTGPITIERVPNGAHAAVVGFAADQDGLAIEVTDCAGLVLLQSLSGRFALHAARAERVFAFGSGFDSVDVDTATVVAARSRATSFVQRGGTVVWSEGEIAGTPRVSAGGRVEIASTAVRALDLATRSHAILSGVDPTDAAIRKDADCDAYRFEPPLPRLLLDAAPHMGNRIRFTMRGPPGASGALSLASASTMVAMHGTGQWLFVDPLPGEASMSVTIPASGELVVDREVATGILGVGGALFAQLMLNEEITLPSGDRELRQRMSYLEGGVVEP